MTENGPELMRSENDMLDICIHAEKNGSDEISGGNQIGSDTFENGSDIIRYPTVILSPAWRPRRVENVSYKKKRVYLLTISLITAVTDCFAALNEGFRKLIHTPV